MDYQSGQLALAPDVASTIIGSLLTPLQKASEIHGFDKTKPPSPCTVGNIQAQPLNTGPKITASYNFYTACLANFAETAKGIYRSLEPAVAPDAHPQGQTGAAPGNDAMKAILSPIARSTIPDLYALEVQFSATIAAGAKLDAIDAASGASKFNPDEATAIRDLAASAALADAIAKDLFGYSVRITDLENDEANAKAAEQEAKDKGLEIKRPPACTNLPAPPKVQVPPAVDNGCVVLFPVGDPPVAKAKMVTRQVTYAIDALNLVQNSQVAIPDSTKKKAIATVTILYGDSHWEGSAGTFFSTLANRSFSVAPVITGGVVTNKQVAENLLHPTIVPFAAVNYRLMDAFPKASWRSAVYWTFAVGVNPNTVSADFASGPSLSWRGLMFSALWHYGHDVRLTQGLYKGEPLGASYSGSATTETFWRSAVALGISVRVPSLTGR
jgi:hypothetical protein